MASPDVARGAKPRSTIRRRQALHQLPQEPLRPTRHKKPSLHSLQQPRNNGSNHNIPRKHRSIQDMPPIENEYSKIFREPLEFGAINTFHSNGSSKRGRHNGSSFNIHIPEETSSSASIVSSHKPLPPRPRTSRGRKDDDQPPPPPPSFTSMFPAANQSEQQMDDHDNDEAQISRFSMTDSEASNDISTDDAALDEAGTAEAESNVSTPRRSKFLEGSMNDRSQGVSSSWDPDKFENADIANHSNVDEPTPKAILLKGKASRVQIGRPGTSKDKDLKANTTKIINNGGHQDHVMQNAKPSNVVHHFGTESQPSTTKQQGLGLRSSRSKFNFQGLAKFRLFGSRNSKPVSTTSKSEEDAYKALMNDRKRKAEVAYAEQFGSKKRRAENRDKETRPPHFSRPLMSMPNDSQTTIRQSPTKVPTPSFNLASTASLASTTQDLTTSNLPKSRSISLSSSIRKRPSRKDLEKENAHLRALLAATRRDNFADLEHHGQDGNPAAITIDEPITLTPGQGMGMIPGKEEMEDVPPVPKLPYGLNIGDSSTSINNSVSSTASLRSQNSGKENKRSRTNLATSKTRGDISDDIEADTKTRRDISNAEANTHPNTKTAPKTSSSTESGKRTTRSSTRNRIHVPGGEEFQWPDDCF